MKLSKYLSFLTFLLILIYLGQKKYVPNSNELNWGFISAILIVGFSALIFKKRERAFTKRNIYVFVFSILGTVLLMYYFI